MKTRSLLLATSLLISTVSLAGGYILLGYWLIVLIIPFMLIVWLLTRKQPVFIFASTLLLAYVILASLGIAIGLSQVLMLIACIFALTSWDLLQFNCEVSDASINKNYGLLEKYRLKSLTLATFAGLMLALFVANTSLSLPFIVIVLLALITLGGLLYSVQLVTRDI